MSEKVVDVTMPCTLRPELIGQTIKSFRRNVIFSGKFNFIINIDMAPKFRTRDKSQIDHYIERILDIVSSAGQSLTFGVGEQPNFATACRTVWRKTKSNFVFHLEDDWTFLQKINLDSAIAHIKEHSFAQIRFPKEKAPKFDRVTCQPCLWLGSHLRDLAAHMITTKDPEKQMRIGSVSKEIDERLPTQNELYDWPGGSYCRDIGREWSSKHGLLKWNKNIDQKEITWSQL